MSVTQISNFDIKTYPPSKFIIDTNVLFFLHSGYQQNNSSKCISYSNFIQQLLTNKLDVIVSVFTIQELLYSIENKEYKLHCRTNGISEIQFTKKDFRKNVTLRTNMQQKLSAVVAQVKALYTIEDDSMLQNWLDDFVSTFQNHRYDPMDYVLVKSMLTKRQNTVFVTDDTDFSADNNITVVTI